MEPTIPQALRLNLHTDRLQEACTLDPCRFIYIWLPCCILNSEDGLLLACELKDKILHHLFSWADTLSRLIYILSISTETRHPDTCDSTTAKTNFQAEKLPAGQQPSRRR